MSDCGSGDTESSLGDEERLRRLFNLCDENGDGYIDSDDLFHMCQELDMVDEFDELVRDLGTEQTGLISVEEFVRRGLSLSTHRQIKRSEVEPQLGLSDAEEFDSGMLVASGTSNSIPNSCESLTCPGAKVEYWKREVTSAASSNPPLGGGGGGSSGPHSGDNSRNSSMGRRNVHPPQSQPTYANINSNSRVPAIPKQSRSPIVQQTTAFRVPSAPRTADIDLPDTMKVIASKQEMAALNAEMKRMALEKEQLEKRLTKMERERTSLRSEFETRLESQAQRYEERITELHGVIFEINKRYDRLHGDTIREEDEDYLEEIEETEEDVTSNSSYSCGAPLIPTNNINPNTGNVVSSQSPFAASNSASMQQPTSTTVPATSNPNPHSQSITPGNHCAQQKATIANMQMPGSTTQLAQDAPDHYGAANSCSRDPYTAEVDALEDELEEVRSVDGKKSASIDFSNMLDDDSIILAIERQTAMACQELEKLGISNLSSLKNPFYADNQHNSNVQSKQANLRNASTGESTSDEILKSKNETINSLDSQLTKCRKENEDLKKLVNSLSAEKRQLKEKLNNVEQMFNSADQGKGPSPNGFNSLTLPNSFPTKPKIGSVNVTSDSETTRGQPPLIPPRLGSLETVSSGGGGNVNRVGSNASMTGVAGLEGGVAMENNNSSSRVVELQLEINRWESKVARMQSELDLLQLTLEESKSTSERVALLCGKYESNATALRLALDYADLCIEALESLLALSSSDMSLQQQSLRSPLMHKTYSNNNNSSSTQQLAYSLLGEFSDCEDDYSMLGLKSLLREEGGARQQAQKRRSERRHAESVAKTILSHLDNTFGKVNKLDCDASAALPPPEPNRASLDRNANRASLFNNNQQADDCSSQGRTSTTSSTNSATSVESDWSRLDESRLRDYIRQLKTETSAVRLTVVNLESIYGDPDLCQLKESRSRGKEKEGVVHRMNTKENEDMLAAFETQRQDLEYAVLTQELMTLKEEKAELRAQMYLAEKEKKQLSTAKGAQDAQLNAYSMQIEHLKQQLQNQTTVDTNSAQPDQSSFGSVSNSDNALSGVRQSSTAKSAHSSFSQSPRSAFSTLSSSASASKSEPVSGSEHNSFATTPIITLEQLSSVAVGHLADTRARASCSGDKSAQKQSAVSNVDMAAAKKREEKLKLRIQELVNALETLSKHCEAKDKQSAEYMADLKRANSALISAYDKAKKKHSSRLKKLESQMKAICERHETTVKVLRQRITLLEESERVKQNRTAPSETSL